MCVADFIGNSASNSPLLLDRLFQVVDWLALIYTSASLFRTFIPIIKFVKIREFSLNVKNSLKYVEKFVIWRHHVYRVNIHRLPVGCTLLSREPVAIKPGFHYPSWRPELTGDRFPLPVNTGRVNGCSFPLAELTGRVYVSCLGWKYGFWIWLCQHFKFPQKLPCSSISAKKFVWLRRALVGNRVRYTGDKTSIYFGLRLPPHRSFSKNYLHHLFDTSLPNFGKLCQIL